MKKKLRCFFERFAALVAALFLSCSSLLPFASAVSFAQADMPSLSDFQSHYGSWFVWRERTVGSYGIHYFELTSSPIFFSSSGSVASSTYTQSYSTSFFDVDVTSGDETLSFACAYPVPFYGASGLWSDLPSFPVGRAVDTSNAVIGLYAYTGDVPTSYSAFLSPVSSSGRHLYYSSSDSSSTDTFSPAVFPSLSDSYPFAFRSETSSIRTSYKLQGGSTDCVSFADGSLGYLGFGSSRFVSGSSSFVTPSFSYSCPSSDLGLVLTSVPVPPSGGTINSASSFSLTNAFVAPTLLVPVGMLPDVKVGDWISDSPEDLQKALTNEFNVDSGKLKDSKDSLNSWNSTSSVDSDVAAGATGLLNAVFQNLGTFLFSVSLLCFGAVVLRMLIKKAVDG